LEKTYPQGDAVRVVLRSANFGFEGGGFYAVRGPSGSGKSTLLNLIAGIDEPTAGEVRIDGVSLSGLNRSQRAEFRLHQVGFVFQFFNLIPTLTVIENVLLPRELASAPGQAARIEAYRGLEQVGLAARGADFPDRLSGGEQQRVAIARALVNRPRLLLADEPTGNLDRKNGESILELLRQRVRQEQATLILVTHSRSVAAQADIVLSIEDGDLARLR
jgi:putative ABC transport system ATP-binding protein